MSILEIYRSYLAGDSLSDEDLVALHNHMKKVVEVTLPLGPRYDMVMADSLRVVTTCEGYLNARGIDY